MTSKFLLMAVFGASAASFGVFSAVGGCPATSGKCGTQTVSVMTVAAEPCGTTAAEPCKPSACGEPVSVQAEPKHDGACSTDGKAGSACCGPKDLVAVISGHEKLTTLAGLIKASGLDKDLKGEKKLTIFAPTDDAFAKLPEATLDMLAKPENKEILRGILLGHAVEGATSSCCLKDGQVVKTLAGSELKVTVKDGKVIIGGATVVVPNVEAGNGMVHAVDSVILPARG